MGARAASARLRLFLDEHYPDAIADRLVVAGFDVVTVSNRKLKRTPDRWLLELAVAEKRAFVTNNHRDFMPLHTAWMAAGRSHHGIVLTADKSMPRTRGNIGQYVTTLAHWLTAHPGDDDLVNQVRWLHPVDPAG